MTELEKAIASVWRYLSEVIAGNGDDATIDLAEVQTVTAAAKSWAKLEWRNGSEKPLRDGDYPVRCASGLRIWTFFEGWWSDDGIGINAGVRFHWLDGALPSVPAEEHLDPVPETPDA